MKRVVVIGGVAAGMSAASQAKRRLPDSEVIVLERGPYVSYGACGMPYNIEDPGRDMQDLVVVTPQRFRDERGLDVRVHHEVLRIDPDAKSIEIADRPAGSTYVQSFDELIIATGARPALPPIEKVDLPGVFVLRELAHGVALKQYLDDASAQTAVIVGGGYIGMEMAEVLRMRGLSVTVLEAQPQILPGYHPSIAQMALETLEANHVVVETNVQVGSIEASRGATPLLMRTSRGLFAADLILLAVGVRPNVSVARSAGVSLGRTGAIAVDARMQTNVPHVWAAGDCAEAWHRVLRAPAYVPLGTTANKQGKVAGANAAGGDERFGGIVGTAGFKLFELEVARTGLSAGDVARHGLDCVVAVSEHTSRGHRYPGAMPVRSVLFVERGSRRLVGAQIIGGDSAAMRINVFATALHAEMTIDAVEGLDLAYAPPFAPVYDPILIAATVARKAVDQARAAAA